MDIKAIVAQMTLEEKASLCSGLDFWHTKPVERLGVASVMVSDGPHGLRKQDEAADHLGINQSIKAVCFPAGCASTASFDRNLVRQIGEMIGDACQHERLSVILGPAINIKRSPLCGRNFEYLSEDPYLAGEMAVALVNGVQSKNVGVSVKHFAGNSQENRRMSSDSVIDERTLREIYFTAFEKVVKQAKPWTVMCSYNRLNGTYASENRWLLTDVLRKEWGFDGYVMSDWGAVSDRVAGVHAGLDLEMPSSGGVNDRRIVEAVRSGVLDEKDVDLAVERILTVNQRYLENAKPETPWDKEAQHAAARRAAAESMVLLKNEADILPLHEGQKIAVIGQFAAEPRFQGGGSSHINCSQITSLLDALQDTPNICYEQGYDVRNAAPDEALIEKACEAAKQADVAVIIAGLPDSFESEGYDRTHLNLPACQNELIARVSRVNPKTVVVLYNGSPVVMPWIDGVAGLVEAYLGGQAVGGATKDILFGQVNPSARLPESFPLKLEDTPCYLSYGGEADNAVYNEGVFVGYRYYEKKNMPVLFPFGYGLSYTSFAYSNLQLSKKQMKDTETVTVTVDVTNTGKVPGKEVVQLYVSDCESTVFRPVRELKGFEKVALNPGETKTVAFTLDQRAFAYWNTQIHDWHVESGSFLIQIGHNSHEMALCESITVEGAELPKHYTKDSIFEDIMKDPKAMQVLQPLLQSLQQAFGGGHSEADADAAITNDMMAAMLKYMPIRNVVSFSGGAVSFDQLDEMLKQI